MGRFSLCSWLPCLILIVQLNVLPWMLNLIIVQLGPQPLLFHTILCVCFSISFWRIYKNNFIASLFASWSSSLRPPAAEGRAVSAILTSMFCQYVVVRQILLKGTGGFGNRRRLELEFYMHTWVWAECSGVLNLFHESPLSNCQKLCKLIVKKSHH